MSLMSLSFLGATSTLANQTQDLQEMECRLTVLESLTETVQVPLDALGSDSAPQASDVSEGQVRIWSQMFCSTR